MMGKRESRDHDVDNMMKGVNIDPKLDQDVVNKERMVASGSAKQRVNQQSCNNKKR